jgi:hypothetical protein
MKFDVAGFHHQYERGGSKQPEDGGDSMDMDDFGYGGLLMEVVVQIKAEADAYEGPEDGEPDERGAAIFARRPGCGCMNLHPPCPPCQAENGE